jgi:hypothetical protein
MPIKVFINEGGRFADRSLEYGLSGTEGWWHAIESADLEGDGDIDFVLGNHGMNSFFRASSDKPVTMYVNDFDLNGRVEQIICSYRGDTLYPVPLMDDLLSQLPVLAARYPKYADYVGQTLPDIFSAEVLDRSVVLSARVLESCILINSGDGSLDLNALPPEAQLAPIFAILAEDMDKDGKCDLLVGGNLSRAKPQTGTYMASYGLLMHGSGEGEFQAVPPWQSGISVRGEVRDLKILHVNDTAILVIARNNDILQFLKLDE